MNFRKLLSVCKRQCMSRTFLLGNLKYLKFLSPQKKDPVTSFGHREVWRVSGAVPVGGRLSPK